KSSFAVAAEVALMAAQYSIKTFLRQVRTPLLKRYFHHKRLTLDVDVVKSRDIDRLYERLQSLPAETIREIETDFAAVTALANVAGTAGLLREAKCIGRDWS